MLALSRSSTLVIASVLVPDLLTLLALMDILMTSCSQLFLKLSFHSSTDQIKFRAIRKKRRSGDFGKNDWNLLVFTLSEGYASNQILQKYNH